jgi:hypothetical protein
MTGAIVLLWPWSLASSASAWSPGGRLVLRRHEVWVVNASRTAFSSWAACALVRIVCCAPARGASVRGDRDPGGGHDP